MTDIESLKTLKVVYLYNQNTLVVVITDTPMYELRSYS